jgi:methionyl-tRNA formyltransferase
MKYVFFGTPEFASVALEKLIAGGMAPIAVVTNPDRPVGRKAVITPPPVKVLAERHGIPVLQPERLGGFESALSAYNADFYLVAAYGKIIPKSILDIPPHGTVGIHPSLLPRHRGASPIQGAILEGDTMTGVSLFVVDEKVDHGPVIATANLSLGAGVETYAMLEHTLADIGADLALAILPDFAAGNIVPKAQDESKATYTKKFRTEEGFIEWKDIEAAAQGDPVAVTLDRMIRALNPEPGTWTNRNGKRMKLLEAELIEGNLKLKTVQYEGKTPHPFS